MPLGPDRDQVVFKQQAFLTPITLNQQSPRHRQRERQLYANDGSKSSRSQSSGQSGSRSKSKSKSGSGGVSGSGGKLHRGAHEVGDGGGDCETAAAARAAAVARAAAAARAAVGLFVSGSWDVSGGVGSGSRSSRVSGSVSESGRQLESQRMRAW